MYVIQSCRIALRLLATLQYAFHEKQVESFQQLHKYMCRYLHTVFQGISTCTIFQIPLLKLEQFNFLTSILFYSNGITAVKYAFYL